MPPFEKKHVVEPGEMDELGHVNNIVYLRWINDMAIAHSAARGWPFDRYVRQGAGWVVRKHEIEYLLPARAGEELLLRTWVAALSRSSCLRRFEAVRIADGKVVARSATLWVWINFATGRLERVPQETVCDFEVLPDPPQESI